MNFKLSFKNFQTLIMKKQASSIENKPNEILSNFNNLHFNSPQLDA